MTPTEVIATKRAETKHPVHPIIRKRWSPRAFSDQDISAEYMKILLEAASWAASSYNEQPWSYIYAHRDDKAGFEKLLGCLNEFNRNWAKGAAVLALSTARTQFGNGKDNRHYLHDTGAANTTMALQAADLDIYCHQMAGFDVDKTKEVFDLPEGTEPASFIALGYVGHPDQLGDDLQEQETASRSRRDLDDFVQRLQ